MERIPFDIGLIGLGVMGENLVLNLESKGFSVAVYNRTQNKVDRFIEGRAAGRNILGARSLKELVDSLSTPKKIILLVKAGRPVDQLLEKILPMMKEGDILVDGGNSFFKDTERRAKSLKARKIRYMGIGISGGEEGALKGPSVMPGGSASAWEIMSEILQTMSAKYDGQACCEYIGRGGAGHFVKMVHNGIEYADMQIICEGYDILKKMGIGSIEAGAIFRKWSDRGELDSYLMDITQSILAKIDVETGNPLVEMLMDHARQKGTGLWTANTALELGVPAPTIVEAVNARLMSGFKQERVSAAECYSTLDKWPEHDADEREMIVDKLHDALLAGKICAYAQGFAILKAGSDKYNWDLDMKNIASIWRNGCIIRASMLEKIRKVYKTDSGDVKNILMDPLFRETMTGIYQNWKDTINSALGMGVPVPALSGALNYFNSYRTEVLPVNLLQAQRDCFGAHTYRRIDRKGNFHSEWQQKND